MFGLVLIAAVGYFFAQFAGYWIHRLLHQPFTGRAFASHTVHHEQAYPPDDYLSEIYRDPPLRDKPFIYYLPFGVVAAALCFVILPLHVAVILSVEFALVAWTNDWLHTAFHVRGHWLERYKWFWRLRELHWHHHVDETANIGIYSFSTDMLMGTFREAPKRPLYLEKS